MSDDMSVSEGLSLDKGSAAEKAYHLARQKYNSFEIKKAYQAAYYTTRGHSLQVDKDTSSIEARREKVAAYHKKLESDKQNDDEQRRETQEDALEAPNYMKTHQHNVKRGEVERLAKTERKKARKTISPVDDVFVSTVLPQISDKYVQSMTQKSGEFTLSDSAMPAALEHSVKIEQKKCNQDLPDPILPDVEAATEEYIPRRIYRRHRKGRFL